MVQQHCRLTLSLRTTSQINSILNINLRRFICDLVCFKQRLVSGCKELAAKRNKVTTKILDFNFQFHNVDQRPAITTLPRAQEIQTEINHHDIQAHA